MSLAMKMVVFAALVLMIAEAASTLSKRTTSFRMLTAVARGRALAQDGVQTPRVPSSCKDAAGETITESDCLTIKQVMSNTRADFTGQRTSCATLFPSQPVQGKCESNHVIFAWAVHAMVRKHEPKPQHCGQKCTTLDNMQESTPCPSDTPAAAACAAARLTWCINTDCTTKFQIKGKKVAAFEMYQGLVMRGDGRATVIADFEGGKKYLENGFPGSKTIKDNVLGHLDLDDHIESSSKAGNFISTSKVSSPYFGSHARGWACDNNANGYVVFFCATGTPGGVCSNNVDADAAFTAWDASHPDDKVDNKSSKNARDQKEVSFIGGIPAGCICGWRKCQKVSGTVGWNGNYVPNTRELASGCSSICRGAAAAADK